MRCAAQKSHSGLGNDRFIAFTPAIAVLATLVAGHMAPAFASDTDLTESRTTQDRLSRSTLRGLSLEQQFQGPMVVAHDPQWTIGVASRLSPPERLPRERVMQPRRVVKAAVRLLASFVEMRQRLSRLRLTRSASAAPVRGRVAFLQLMSRVDSSSSPVCAVRYGESQPTPDASHRLPWIWSLHSLTYESWYDGKYDLSAGWVPWRPRGPPAFSTRTLSQDAIR